MKKKENDCILMCKAYDVVFCNFWNLCLKKMFWVQMGGWIRSSFKTKIWYTSDTDEWNSLKDRYSADVLGRASSQTMIFASSPLGPEVVMISSTLCLRCFLWNLGVIFLMRRLIVVVTFSSFEWNPYSSECKTFTKITGQCVIHHYFLMSQKLQPTNIACSHPLFIFFWKKEKKREKDSCNLVVCLWTKCLIFASLSLLNFKFLRE